MEGYRDKRVWSNVNIEKENGDKEKVGKFKQVKY